MRPDRDEVLDALLAAVLLPFVLLLLALLVAIGILTTFMRYGAAQIERLRRRWK